MIVAFFSEGPSAAMAALLTRAGLVALGASPAGLTLSDRLVGRGLNTILVDGLLDFIATCGGQDIVLALPMSLLPDRRVRAAVEVAVSVGPDVDGAGVFPQMPTAWHLAVSDEFRVSEAESRPRGAARSLPLRLPPVHPTANTFVRGGVPCAPPVRDALRLVAILQALSADPDAADVEACLQELLRDDGLDGSDPAVDRLRAIADRLAGTPDRDWRPMPRRTARDIRGHRADPDQPSARARLSWPHHGSPSRSAGRRR